VLAAVGQDRIVDLAAEEVVRGLKRLDRYRAFERRHLLGVEVGYARVPDLALFDEL
jgi:hypothetical protein